MFALGDAWISVSAEKASRGRLLAVYATVLGVMSVGSQLLIQVLPEDLSEAFILVSLLYCVAIVVLTAARSDPPTVQSSANVRVRGLFKDSPTAWVGAFTVGMVATTLLNVTPYRAAIFGISTKEIALLIGALYLGRILFIYPLGWASDRHDRRVFILINGVIASALLLYFSIVGSGDGSAYHAIFETIWHSVFLDLMVILGGALLTMYSLLVAHAMDRTPPVYVAAASVTMLFVTTVGGIAGPLVVSLVSAVFEDSALHWALFLMLAGFAVFVSVRFAKRDASSPAEKTSHVVAGTTSTEVAPDNKR
ncbi:putative MFS-type transporter YcaD [Ruegeria atlantica]|uniref:Putative MFS-type transporter YcaD n=1 Tax=Ruegeria atlantica TaxID=81569 RepID=A0A0P1EKQ2_9RHOB|nr:MFS transporter [Ruegeria atlantica]CUH42032.1 putative MFS-type transporter YcaD [Ruegeria atlantica]